MGIIKGVKVTPLKIIPVDAGDVFHGLRKDSNDFLGFGEAYFSTIHYKRIKPWKRHRLMTLNLIVVSGMVRFVVHDDRIDSETYGSTSEYTIGLPNSYARLTIEPGIWMAFQGMGKDRNLLLNIADIIHDPEEVDRADLNKFAYNWGID